MKRFLVLCLVLGVLGLALVRGILAQTSASVGVNSQAEFDHNGLDSGGNPEQLKDSDLAIAPAALDLNTGSAPTKVVTGTLRSGANVVPLAPLFTGVPGGDYRLWVRARDQAGNVSAWSASPSFTLDATNPSAPANVRVTVIVTVGG